MRARLATVIAVILVAAGWWLWAPLPDFEASSEYLAVGEPYDVEVLRDEWGVPHILGKRDRDTAFGLAYAHAEDDFENIQLTLAVSRGQLARHKGFEAAATDYLVALMGVWDAVERGYDTAVSPEARQLAEAYAAGLNLYAAEHPKERWPGLFPATGQDIVAGFLFKTPLFYGLDRTLLGIFEGKPHKRVALNPEAAGQMAWTISSRPEPELGSNAFAVSPDRSGDGHTRLVINSHQPFTGPVAWYEVHLRSDEGLDVWGGTFPGAPLVLHGFNRHLGWANTVNQPDLTDVYALVTDPAQPEHYLLDGKWIPFEQQEVTINVRLFGPFAFPAKRIIRKSVHGPVIEGPEGMFAVRFAGYGELGHIEQYRQLNLARSLEQWLAGMAINAAPSINYVYADQDGNIGFIYNAKFPLREKPADWQSVLPGDDSGLIWEAYRPFDEIPSLFNPQSGFIFNANNTPFSATDGDDNLAFQDFPQSMGLERKETNRSLRLAELGRENPLIGKQELLQIKFDNRYSEKSLAAAIRDAVSGQDWSAEPGLEQAAKHLAAWDLGTEVDNRRTAIGVLSAYPAIWADLGGEARPDPLDSFREAAEFLTVSRGSLDVPWGQINRLVRGDRSWPVSGGPDVLRAIYGEKDGESGELRATAGDTYIAVVQWDEKGRLSAESIHQFGSATLDPASPHFADQAELFAGQRFKPVLTELDDIIERSTRRYRPGHKEEAGD
jgi:penicillin amidase/acyl-homoserine-lactone acylase